MEKLGSWYSELTLVHEEMKLKKWESVFLFFLGDTTKVKFPFEASTERGSTDLSTVCGVMSGLSSDWEWYQISPQTVGSWQTCSKHLSVSPLSLGSPGLRPWFLGGWESKTPISSFKQQVTLHFPSCLKTFLLQFQEFMCHPLC